MKKNYFITTFHILDLIFSKRLQDQRETPTCNCLLKFRLYIGKNADIDFEISGYTRYRKDKNRGVN